MDDNQFQAIPLEEEPNTFRQRQVRRAVYALFGIAGIFVISALVWFFLGSSSSFTDKNIELSIEAPKEVSSGEKVNYVVKLKNKNTKALNEVRLVFFYPSDSVVLKDGQPALFLTEEVKIGEVEGGGDVQMQYKFPAYLVGDRGEVKKAKAKLVFAPEQVRSTFEKEVEAVTNIASLDMALTLVAPPNAVSGQSVSYILDYRNESSKDLSDLKIKFSYPDGFTPASFNPTPIGGNHTWQIKIVKPGEGNRIIVEGVLRGAERENKGVAVVLQRLTDGVEIDYQKSSTTTVISTPPLATEVSINSQIGAYTAKLGEALNYQIKFTNNSEVDLSGLTITAKLEGSMFDFNSVRTTGFFDPNSRLVTWNASSSPLLNRLSPGQYGVVDFTINLKGAFPSSGLGAKDFVVKTSIKAETFTIPPGFYGDVLTAQAETVTKIKSLPSLEQVGHYSGGGLSGSGPLPPRVEQKTVYTVVWRLSNTSGDVLKTRMKATLPTGINWENQVLVNGTAIPPTFKNSTREVIWDVGVLPAGTGSTTPKYEVWFQISATPNSSQVGTLPQLIKDLSLEGEDGSSHQTFVLRGRELSTSELADRPNQGVVTE